MLAHVSDLDRKIKESHGARKAATGTGVLALYGVGPTSAAWILGDVPDVARLVSWNGTAPLDASSGEDRSAA